MWKWLCAAFVMLCLCSCGKVESDSSLQTLAPQSINAEPVESEKTKFADSEENEDDVTLKICVGEYEFFADFEENSSAEEFRNLLSDGPITIEMEDYGGFEKVGSIGTSLVRNDEQITTEPGDVILYQGNQITIYYASNTWNFTKLAKIKDPVGLKEKLGDGNVSVTFSLD